MRVAVCLSGFLRNYLHTNESMQKHVIRPWKADIFYYGYPNNLGMAQCLHDLPQIYAPKKYELIEYTDALRDELRTKHNVERFYHNKRNETSIDGMLSQYLNLYKSNELKTQYEVEQGFKYDVVIKSRPDVFWFRDITTDEIEQAASGKLLAPYEWDFKEVRPWAVTDVFAMSSSPVMDVYSNIYHKIDEYFDEGCVLHHESMTGYHIMKSGIDRVAIKNHFWFEYPADYPAAVKDRRAY